MRLKEKFQILSDLEHVKKRPEIYVGSINPVESTMNLIKNDKIMFNQTVNYIPGLVKIIYEILDNSIDNAIKTNFEYANKIEVNFTPKQITVKDNGTGIHIEKINDQYTPVIAWSTLRSGTNFSNDESNISIGRNGVGSCLTNFLSSKFIGKTADESKEMICEFENGVLNNIDLKQSKKHFTEVTFIPDFDFFKIKEMDSVYSDIILNRLYFLAISFPEITFYFNGNKIKVKKLDEFFDSDFESLIQDNYQIYVLRSENYNHITYLNGLDLFEGSTINDYILNSLVSAFKDKFKKIDLKPNEIKNNFTIIGIYRNFKNPKYSSQMKTKLVNNISDVKNYLNDDIIQKFVNKVVKNKSLIDPIIDYYKFKQNYNNRKEIENIEKKVVNIPNYIQPNSKTNRELYIFEGNSAMNAFRKFRKSNQGAITLKGKPSNVYLTEDVTKIKQELLNIAKVLNLSFTKQSEMSFDRIYISSDQDEDGFQIASLVILFFYKYWKNLFKEKRIFKVETPLFVVKNDNKKQYYYSHNEFNSIKDLKNAIIEYKKGLASLDDDEYNQILDPEKRKVLSISLSDVDDQFLKVLFDDDTKDRKDLFKELGIFENA